MWTIKITDVTTPSLDEILVSFSLFLDEKVHVSNSIRFSPEELNVKDKDVYIKVRIEEIARKYTSNYVSAEPIKTLKDTTWQLS